VSAIPKQQNRSNFLFKAFFLICLYCFGAFLSLFLTFEPSYVNPFWFPTGIAVAFLLIHGRRLWPAVFFGALFTVPQRVGILHFGFYPMEMLLLIAIGSTMQCVVAVWFIRRFLGPAPSLANIKTIFTFFAVTALSTIISAAIGVTTLAVHQQIEWNSISVNFLSWLIGDTMSIFLITPMIFTFYASERDIWGERRWSFVLPLVFSIVSLLILSRVVHQWEQSRIRVGFERKTELIAKIFEKEINNQFDALKAVKGFYGASVGFDRMVFHEFTIPLLQSYPALVSLEWVPRVFVEDKDKIIDQARREGIEDFDVKNFVFPGEIGSEIKQKELYPVLYIEPFENHRVFLGYDRGSNAEQWEMLGSTRDKNQLALGSWINLITKDASRGVLGALAVYKKDAHLDTPEARQENLSGFILGVFNMRSFVKRYLREFQEQEINVNIFDDEGIRREIIYSFYKTEKDLTRYLKNSYFLSGHDFVFEQQGNLKIADRNWPIAFDATPAYFKANRTGIMWIVVLGGLSLLGIVAAFLLAVTGRTAEIEMLVLERTAQLEESRSEAVKIASQAQDARMRAELAEQAAHRMKEKAQEAAETKSRFLANMSHEIRTPINAILGFTDLLGQTQLDEKQIQYLLTVRSSSEMLLSIINDILDFSKIDAGKLSLEMIDFDLEYLIGDVFKMTIHKIQGKNIQTYIDISDDIDRYVKGDPTRLRQILLNLLGNAVKFTQQGEIGIVVRRDLIKSTEDHPVIQFIVKDTGIGIAKDKMEKIFAPFSQADESTARKYGGTGLGLSIVQSLVKMMHGHVWLESEPGKGSQFIFYVKFDKGRPITQDNIHPLSTEQLKNILVFIVDGNKQSREILSKYCEQLQMKIVKVAVNENDALEFFKQNGSMQEPPDVVLCDIPMATSLSNEVIRRIKEQKKIIKMIALSSDVKLGITKELEGYGFHGFLPKPVTRYELSRVIATVMGDQRRKGSIVTRHMAEELKCKGVKILVAEDVLANQQLLKAYLDMLGCVGEYVNNGKEAIEKLKKNKYDICLMDIQMPVMGGVEASKIIRAEISKTLPIVALTAEDVIEEEKKYLAAGMTDCLHKPLDVHHLRDKIAKYILKEA
jgi:signal transduction histidine kinase/CheY-like chemotaxis protein